MAQHLHGRLSNYQIVGLTRLSGHLGAPSSGRASMVAAEGALSAAGLHGPSEVLAESHGIGEGLPGGTWLISSNAPIRVDLPSPSSSRSFRFILGMAPSSGFHEVHAGDWEIWGGFSILNTVPGGSFAHGAKSLLFAAGASAGARVSLYAAEDRWYIADGLAFESGAISFG